MINQLFLVGQIKDMPKMEVNNKNIKFKIEVKRNYKNVDGIFEKDIFECFLWIAIGKKISMYSKIGDVVAVKGRLVSDNDSCHILAEQVILLNKVMEANNIDN